MMYYIALALLWPLFYLQGKFVRWFKAQLPEPDGERVGQVGEGEELLLLITGDSAAAGGGVGHQRHALSGTLVSALSATRAVSWRLLAQSGDSSSRLLEKLTEAPANRVEIVVVSIGVNDVTSLTSCGRWVTNLHALATLLRAKFGAKQIYLSSIPPMHLFPGLPNPLRWWLGLRARQFNELMQAVAENEVGCMFVQVPYPLDPSYIAADGFHPGKFTYKLWGEHIAEMIHISATVG